MPLWPDMKGKGPDALGEWMEGESSGSSSHFSAIPLVIETELISIDWMLIESQ